MADEPPLRAPVIRDQATGIVAAGMLAGFILALWSPWAVLVGLLVVPRLLADLYGEP